MNLMKEVFLKPIIQPGIFLIYLFLLIGGINNLGLAQTGIKQTIRGKITDKDSKSGMLAVTIRLYKDSVLLTGTSSDAGGNYRLPDVPIGKYSLKANLVGYLPFVTNNIVVNTAKEVILNFEMEESAVKIEAVVITSSAHPGEAQNDMAMVSARTFSVEESNRYAGSRGDPARMASNFAGVQGADDSRNDIVVRGNSPLGVLWRLEGVDIPNPNHFAVAGTTGGPVSMLNNKMLENSDFYTGAFPSEYGNGIAGVFDLKMRNGNNEKTELTAQLGFLGTELTAEGPLSKKSGASYLATYRYSSLALFSAAHINIGTNAVPHYQDGSFKLNFPLKHGGDLSFFGLGGMSNIDIVVSNYTSPAQDLYGVNNENQLFGSSTGVVGASYSKSINANSYFKFTLAASQSGSYGNQGIVYRGASFKLDSVVPNLAFRFSDQKYSFNFLLNRKYTSKLSLKTGIFNDLYRTSTIDSAYNINTYKWMNRWDNTTTYMLFQPYIQLKYKLNDQLVFTGGLHAQYLTLNGSKALEPRMGARYTINSKQSVGFGAGMHSQMLPTYVYFYHQQDAQGNYLRDANGNYYLHNLNVDFIRSAHFVLSYDNYISKGTHLKVETYYQHLYNVPIEKKSSAFSLMNQGSGFSRFFPDTLVNKGTGDNYGVEITLEKFFSKSFFFMLTGSVFNSTYTGSDGVVRNTDFNGIYAANLLVGKEVKLSARQKLSLGLKITAAGGHRFTPIDTAASRLSADIVYVDSKTNSLQLKDYFRIDAKFNYILNTKKLTHEIGLDLVNVTNNKNVLSQSYNRDGADRANHPIVNTYQLGFLPLFYYKIDF
ncbi:MAG: carboxypeptidase regulatory-like domain-containing protein [Bacteroidia bacterium]